MALEGDLKQKLLEERVIAEARGLYLHWRIEGIVNEDKKCFMELYELCISALLHKAEVVIGGYPIDYGHFVEKLIRKYKPEKIVERITKI
ncbi:hypothetical protein HZA33_03580 [Candidatus Pacearchaeota archaeon]|nr:hypothetical protein [Candidatus Pacearchaeota archaeon]